MLSFCALFFGYYHQGQKIENSKSRLKTTRHLDHGEVEGWRFRMVKIYRNLGSWVEKGLPGGYTQTQTQSVHVLLGFILILYHPCGSVGSVGPLTPPFGGEM